MKLVNSSTGVKRNVPGVCAIRPPPYSNEIRTVVVSGATSHFGFAAFDSVTVNGLPLAHCEFPVSHHSDTAD